MDSKLKLVISIANTVKHHGGELWIIGGFVRDMLYKEMHSDIFVHPSKDIDCEVYGLPSDDLANILSHFGKVDDVGKQFGVLLLTSEEGKFDFSLPRMDSSGRKPDVEIDPWLSKEIACSRRSFTINSAMYDPLTGDLLDFYGARRDTNHLLLDPVSNHFSDDPLRPLIGLQLAGRYGLKPSYSCVNVGFNMMAEYPKLPPSRVWGEWWKWASQSVIPSMGLNYLTSIHWDYFYPTLYVLDQTEQDPEWHPEGDVAIHTRYVVDEAAEIAKHWSEEDRGVLVLAALTHDFDKTITTETVKKDGQMRIVSPGHDAGIKAEEFLNEIYCPNDIKERVLALVRTHMAHVSGMVPRKLVKRLGSNTSFQWLSLVYADHSGRPPLPKETPVEALKLFEEMERQPPEVIKPLVMGRHLLELGFKPGPEMGKILKPIEEAQLEGLFDTVEGGLEWARQNGLL